MRRRRVFISRHIAAIISYFIGDAQNMLIILAIVILNMLLGYYQENQAEQAHAALAKMPRNLLSEVISPMKPDSGAMFNNANSYESYMGRWSRLVAQQVVAWLHIAPGQIWLDVGAGTGILTQIILQQASPAKVIGIDSSPEYVEFACEHIHDDRAEFRVGDAVNLPFESQEFDVAVSGLVLNFRPTRR